MEQKPLSATEIRDQIDTHVNHAVAWAVLIEALERKEPELIELPVSTLAEAARSIRGSVTQIRDLVDALVAQSNAHPWK